MSGMEPMLIGAALGGGISAARGGNPLTGALLGGLTGGIGSGIMGAAGTAASNAASSGLTAAGGTLAPTIGSSIGAGGSAIGGATGLTAPAMTGFGLTPATAGLSAGQAALQAPSVFGGVGLTSAAAPTFMQTAKEIPGAMMDYLKQNPMEALKMSQSLLGEQQPIQPQQGMLAHGTPMQLAQDQQYSYAAPKVSLI